MKKVRLLNGNCGKFLTARRMDRIMNSLSRIFPDYSCDVEDSVISSVERRDIHKVINQLDAEERMIIYGIYFENKTQVQLAGIMGVSRQVLAYKLNIILNKMRRMYQENIF